MEQISLFENLHIGEGNGGRKGDKEIRKKEERKKIIFIYIYLLNHLETSTLSLHGKWQYTHTNKL